MKWDFEFIEIICRSYRTEETLRKLLRAFEISLSNFLNSVGECLFSIESCSVSLLLFTTGNLSLGGKALSVRNYSRKFFVFWRREKYNPIL